MLAQEGRAASAGSPSVFSLAGVALTLRSDDPDLVDVLASVLGAPSDHPAASGISVEVHSRSGDPFGFLRFDGLAPADLTADDLLLGLESPEFPFRVVAANATRTSFAFGDDLEPLLELRGAECRFRKAADWRVAVALLLHHRLMRARRDAIFFHAASVGIAGRGVLFVGPKGAGKSTTALALSARGHAFFGDETAAWLPASGEIIAVRRPVGIKPGPRATAVEAGLARTGRSPERDGILRLDVGALLTAPEPAPAALRAIVFLSGFVPLPRLTRVVPGRDELAQLQPSVASLVNAPRAQRVFELARMLSSAAVYRLSPGEPDATAACVEEVIAGQ